MSKKRLATTKDMACPDCGRNNMGNYPIIEKEINIEGIKFKASIFKDDKTGEPDALSLEPLGNWSCVPKCSQAKDAYFSLRCKDSSRTKKIIEQENREKAFKLIADINILNGLTISIKDELQKDKSMGTAKRIYSKYCNVQNYLLTLNPDSVERKKLQILLDNVEELFEGLTAWAVSFYDGDMQNGGDHYYWTEEEAYEGVDEAKCSLNGWNSDVSDPEEVNIDEAWGSLPEVN